MKKKYYCCTVWNINGLKYSEWNIYAFKTKKEAYEKLPEYIEMFRGMIHNHAADGAVYEVPEAEIERLKLREEM